MPKTIFTKKDVLELTKEMVSIPSVSRQSNVPIADHNQAWLETAGFVVERTEYTDENGALKINLVGKLGEGTGGIAFCSHNDVVPGGEWDAFTPVEKGDLLYGRGSCDMKGPLSATMVAATAFEPAVLKKPIYIVITADEELGLRGAKRLIHTSDMLKRDRPEWGIVAEPTSLVPIYAHKGMGVVEVIAQGRAAHSATGLGESALLKIAPFLRDLHEIDQLLQSDTSFQDDEFVPAHHTINPIIDIGEAAMNVTAAQAIVRVSVRMMPNARSSEAVEMIAEKARGYGFETAVSMHKPMYVERDSALVTMCETVTGEKAQTVSFGTDGAFLQEVIEQIVVMGPGDIGVAHTVNEHVSIRELYRAVDVYKTLIQRFCI